MADIVIVASAFGVDAIRRNGHGAFVAAAAAAAAQGFEVRRELFASEDEAGPGALSALGGALADAGLWAVYSTPESLYLDDGALNRDALGHALAEADALGARYLKFQLGGYAGTTHAAAIAAAARGARTRIVVENAQPNLGGALAQFTGLFASLRDEGAAELFGMTFDIGNWLWAGEVPLKQVLKNFPT